MQPDLSQRLQNENKVETKSAKLNRETVVSAELLTKKLSTNEGLTMKKMFGGHGVFHDRKMLGIADSKGNYFFKANETNKADFEQKRSVQYSRIRYYGVPNQIFTNPEDLITWAQKPIDASKQISQQLPISTHSGERVIIDNSTTSFFFEVGLGRL